MAVGGGDAIFLVEGQGTLVRQEQGPYTSEAVLQDLLARYPDLLAGHQINRVSPRRWLLVGREVGVPHQEGGGDRWSVDHLFLDQDGIPTIVEVKRATDTRIRREVVGQMLDYAANGVVTWPVDRLRQQYVARCEQEGADPEEVLCEHLVAGTLEPETFWDRVAENLRDGRVRLIFVADEIPSELRRIVEFLNVRMQPTEVLAVELRQYIGVLDDREIRTLVPRVIGATESSEEGAPRKGYAQLLRESPAALRQIETELFGWAEANGLRTPIRRTARLALLEGVGTILWLYPVYGIYLNLVPLREGGRDGEAETLLSLLRQHVDRKLTSKQPCVPPEILPSVWPALLDKVLPPYLRAFRSLDGQILDTPAMDGTEG